MEQLMFVESNSTISSKWEDMLVKERVEKYGATTLLDEELITLLTGISKDKLMDNRKPIHELIDNIHELNVTDIQRKKLEALFELSKRINKKSVDRKKVSSPDAIADLLMEDMRYLKKEHFKVVLLNTKHKVLAVETISIGSLNASIVHPREVFKAAIKESASAIILVHNHPSGDPKPSHEDISITKRLLEAGELMSIRVLDHIIIGDGTYFSLKDKDLI